MTVNSLPPIPQDEIKENPRWREWFRNLGNYIQQTQLGNIIVGIAQGGTGTNTAAGARASLGVPAKPVGSSILAGDGSGELQNVTIGTNLTYSAGVLNATTTGGVSQIVAGTNVTISPSGGTGVVTINSSIATTGVTAATYGSASSVPVIAVNAQGQATSVTDTPISISNANITGGITATITTAKLTTLGTNGSMTFTNGILTAQTAAT